MGCNCNGCPVRDVAAMAMVIVEVPEGVMMGGGPVVMVLLLMLLLPQPVAWMTEQSRIATIAPFHAKRLTRRPSDIRRLFHAKRPMWRPSNICRFLTIIAKSRANARRGRTRIPAGGAKRFGIKGGNAAPPLVDMVTVNGAGAPFAIVTVGGTWHIAPSGAPLQASVTVPL